MTSFFTAIALCSHLLGGCMPITNAITYQTFGECERALQLGIQYAIDQVAVGEVPPADDYEIKACCTTEPVDWENDDAIMCVDNEQNRILL